VALYQSGYSLQGFLPAYGEKAERFLPVLYAFPNDPPSKVLYSFTRDGGVEYYYIWRGEKSGTPLIDQLYNYVRMLFYGSAADVESVTVNPLNRTLVFETLGHQKIVAKFTTKDCSYDNVKVPNCVVNKTHVKVYVLTWNHLFSLLPVEDTVPQKIKAEPMTPAQYIQYAIVRRMNESIKQAVAIAIGKAILITVVINLFAYWIFLRVKRKSFSNP